VRLRLTPWLLALAGAAVVLYLGTPTEDIFWSDFIDEAWPAFAKLIDGDVGGFLSSSPVAYGGSMVVRAPFGAAAGALGFEEPGVYRIGALPCLLALAALAAHLGARARAQDPTGRWWLLVVGLAGANPIAWQALWYGHPEELLTTALAVGAILVALGGRAVVAGALLGAAIASKQWAVLAVLPTVLALPRDHLKLLVTAAGTSVALLAPIVLADPGAFAAAQQGVVSSAQWFRPRQLWWPFGIPATEADAPAGATVTPGWIAAIAKPLIVGVSVPLAAFAVRRRGNPMLLFALLMLARCLLDPWNSVYYHLPLIVALVAWEVLEGRGIPAVGLLTTGAVWLTFVSYDAAYSTGPWVAYLAWTLPLAGYLAHRLYAIAPATLVRPCAGPSSAARRSSPSTSTT
jgi:hypothetical protein